MPAQNILWTGQTHCFNPAGKKLDCSEMEQTSEREIAAPWPEPRFEIINEDIIKDRATELIWPRNASLTDFTLNWQESLLWVAQMNREYLFGKNDWRLPNRRELRSLIDHSRRNPALPSDHLFINLAIGWHWTSTSSAVNPRYAWYVHTEGGRMFYGNKTENYWVLPVSGTSNKLSRTGQDNCFDSKGVENTCKGEGQDGALRCGLRWPEPRFVSDSLGILDRLTGLIWHPGANLTRKAVSWGEALEAVKMYASATGQPFRLPTINELESLVDASRHSPALPANHSFEAPQEAYWSSTTSGFETDWGYVLYLHKGAVGVGYKANKDFYAWPVMHIGQKKI